MKPNHSTPEAITFVLQLAALATLLIGLATLFLPELVGSLFGGNHTDNYHFVRFTGAALVGFAVLNWFASQLKNSELVRPVVYGNFASLMIATAVDVIGLVQHIFSGGTWFALILHVVFAGLFAYCILILAKKGDAAI